MVPEGGLKFRVIINLRLPTLPARFRLKASRRATIRSMLLNRSRRATGRILESWGNSKAGENLYTSMKAGKQLSMLSRSRRLEDLCSTNSPVARWSRKTRRRCRHHWRSSMSAHCAPLCSFSLWP